MTILLPPSFRTGLRQVYATSGQLMANKNYEGRFLSNGYTQDLQDELRSLMLAKRVDPERLRLVLEPLQAVYTALASETGVQAQSAKILARDFDLISGGQRKFGAAEDMGREETGKARALTDLNKTTMGVLVTIAEGMKLTDPEEKVISLDRFRRAPKEA